MGSIELFCSCSKIFLYETVADIDQSAPCKREENGTRWSHPRNCQFVKYCKWGNLSHSGTHFVNEIELFCVTIFCFLHVTRREKESTPRVLMKLKMKGRWLDNIDSHMKTSVKEVLETKCFENR